jgi:hypothetical protein
MARRILIVLLGLGAVGGYWSALHHQRWPDRREAFERHVADLCTDAALRASKHALDTRAPAP